MVALTRGPIIQTAWVTADIDATERYLREMAGAGRWTRLESIRFGPDECRYRGDPADFSAHISLSYVEDMQLELIQPLEGESIYTEFLGRSGPGLHHICFETADLDQAVEEARGQGIEAVQRGTMAGGTMRFAYLDGAASGVPFVELAEIHPEMRDFFAAVRANAKS